MLVKSDDGNVFLLSMKHHCCYDPEVFNHQNRINMKQTQEQGGFVFSCWSLSSEGLFPIISVFSQPDAEAAGAELHLFTPIGFLDAVKGIWFSRKWETFFIFSETKERDLKPSGAVITKRPGCWVLSDIKVGGSASHSCQARRPDEGGRRGRKRKVFTRASCRSAGVGGLPVQLTETLRSFPFLKTPTSSRWPHPAQRKRSCWGRKCLRCKSFKIRIR